MHLSWRSKERKVDPPLGCKMEVREPRSSSASHEGPNAKGSYTDKHKIF